MRLPLLCATRLDPTGISLTVLSSANGLLCMFFSVILPNIDIESVVRRLRCVCDVGDSWLTESVNEFKCFQHLEIHNHEIRVFSDGGNPF